MKAKLMLVLLPVFFAAELVAVVRTLRGSRRKQGLRRW